MKTSEWFPLTPLLSRIESRLKQLTQELHLVDRQVYGHMSRAVFTSQDELYQVRVIFILIKTALINYFKSLVSTVTECPCTVCSSFQLRKKAPIKGVYHFRISSRDLEEKIGAEFLDACKMLQLLFGWERIYRLNLTDKLCGNMLSPFYSFMLQFCRSLTCLAFWILLLEMDSHEHILTYTLGQEWLIHLYMSGNRRIKVLISLLLLANWASLHSFIFIHSSQPPHSLQS